MGGGHAGENSSRYPQLASGPKGKQITHIYKDRLDQFRDEGQYREQGIKSKIFRKRISGTPHIKLEVYSPPGTTRPFFDEITSKPFVAANKGDSFGPSWTTHWFKVWIKVPEDFIHEEQVELHWNAGNEALIYDEHGTPIQGLAGIGLNSRLEWIIPKSWHDGKIHLIYIEMACNEMFGNSKTDDSRQPPVDNKYFKLLTVDLLAINMEARQLNIDYWMISDAAKEFPSNTPEQHHALQICNKIINTFALGNGSDESIIECRSIAEEYIGNVRSAKVFDNDKAAVVNAIGNCHIDSCWLWPFAETKRKVVRSWMNQCDLLERYPELRFVASQAQQWKWLETLYPKAFDRVKEKVKEGRFQPIGGSWVEHDTNMPNGESLVRQFLYGQRYFESRFGKRCRTFWLPDTFGYSSQLPQICRLAGMPYFFTQKLSWNNINEFDHTTFNWVGLDNSQVLCHMAPCGSYDAKNEFGDVLRSVSQHKSLDQNAMSLLPFGYGDGGGGPTWDDMEKLRRLRGIADTTGRLPRAKYAESVDDFYAEIEKKAEKTPLTTWYGELYLELHRGTYTTQANNKRGNRRAEVLLHHVEYFATMASLQNYASDDAICSKKSEYKYPKKEIDEMWEKVLLCQFHDCLPGSSIRLAYDESDKMYAEVFKSGHDLIKDALCELDCGEALLNDQYQVSARDQLSTILGGCYSVPVITSSTSPTLVEVSHDVFQYKGPELDVTISGGVITSLKLHGREYIPQGGKGNQYVIFDDKPLYWQAWDVEIYHFDTRQELCNKNTRIISNTSEDIRIETTTKISDVSSIKTQYIFPTASSSSQSLLSIQADISWHETMKFLKVEFPTNLTSLQANYETQFGIIQRPTHYNTTWDAAKFEVCSHRFADLSESTAGLSILNESKYGFAVSGPMMRLSLLRSPKMPDKDADMSDHHSVKWGILPHKGPLDMKTILEARRFNARSHISSLVPFHNTTTTITNNKNDKRNGKRNEYYTHPFTIKSNHPNNGFIIDNIKRGEDDVDVSPYSTLADENGHGGLEIRKTRSVVLRIYDALGGRDTARLVISGLKNVKRVRRCNLLEDDIGNDLELIKTNNENGSDGGDERIEVEFELRAFEILSLRVEFE